MKLRRKKRIKEEDKREREGIAKSWTRHDKKGKIDKNRSGDPL